MKKNPVPCPQCGRRIFDAENGIKTQTKVIVNTVQKMFKNSVLKM